MMFVLAVIWLSACFQACLGTDDNQYNFYDVNILNNQIRVDCGTPEDQKIEITYGGEVNRVYGADDPDSCEAAQVAPGVYRLLATLSDGICSVQNPDTDVLTLNVVVQKGYVRQWDDSYHLVTCNYGPAGQQESSVTNTGVGEAVENKVVWGFVENSTTSAENVTLLVYDTDNSQVASTTLGSYIQLRAYIDTDKHIKMFNCRAFTDDLSYYFLINGCGEGDVLSDDRGFRADLITGDPEVAGATRSARSAFFKSFLLPGKTSITFECDYILCQNCTSPSYSCSDSISIPTSVARKRRQAPNTELTYPRSTMPKVASATIEILPQSGHDQYIVASHDLVQAEGGSPRRYTEVIVEPTAAAAAAEDMNTLTLGLIVGLAFLGLLLLVTLSCAVVLCQRSLHPAMYQGYSSSLASYPLTNRA